MNLKCALIGAKLGHSYSKLIHEQLGNYSYDLVELEPNDLENFIKSKQYDAYNVTIPYKVDVFKFLDDASELAKSIGAVNTVYCRNGALIGDNTDFLGMIYALDRAKIQIKDRKVMILGSGGTSKTARAVCENLGAREIIIVSRNGQVNYQNYNQHADAEVIINTTPVGMYPITDQSPIDLNAFTNLQGVFDAIYNPSLTKLLFSVKLKGVNYTNGLPMLVAQAKYASELFTGNTIADDIIEKIILTIEKKNKNVVLIGIPGCGKSTIGKLLAKRLEREVIDTDSEIEKECKCDIPKIFADNGEDYFRQVESLVAKKVGILTGKVIATGGGIIKRKENLFYLKQNATIIFLDRELSSLAKNNRPLSSGVGALEKLYSERIDSYREFADIIVDNNQSLEDVVEGVISKL